MNLQQLKLLSDDELRIKVAKALGWKRFPEKDKPFKHTYWARFGEDCHFLEDTLAYACSLPDWPNDLNACHKMEKSLAGWGKQVEYMINLREIACSDKIGWTCDQFELLNATARQRCIAFLMTIGETE